MQCTAMLKSTRLESGAIRVVFLLFHSKSLNQATQTTKRYNWILALNVGQSKTSYFSAASGTTGNKSSWLVRRQRRRIRPNIDHGTISGVKCRPTKRIPAEEKVQVSETDPCPSGGFRRFLSLTTVKDASMGVLVTTWLTRNDLGLYKVPHAEQCPLGNSELTAFRCIRPDTILNFLIG